VAGGLGHRFAPPGQDEEIGPAIVRVRDSPDETPVDEPLDVVAERRSRHARGERDGRRAHRGMVPDMRQEGEEIAGIPIGFTRSSTICATYCAVVLALRKSWRFVIGLPKSRAGCG
jgi:hypothetical protein